MIRIPCPRSTFVLPLALFVSCSGGAMAAEVSGTAALTTDYVWRGTSQSNEGAAAQAGLKVTGQRGFYAQAWGSSVEFAPQTRASTELDVVAGWSGALPGNTALDISVTRYLYPSAVGSLDWTETSATLTWRDHYWMQVAHARDALASGAAGTYAQLGARVALNETLRLEGAAGRYWLATDSGYADYTHLQFGAVWAFAAPFELRLTLHDTDAAARRGFGAWAGTRVEAAVQASF